MYEIRFNELILHTVLSHDEHLLIAAAVSAIAPTVLSKYPAKNWTCDDVLIPGAKEGKLSSDTPTINPFKNVAQKATLSTRSDGDAINNDELLIGKAALASLIPIVPITINVRPTM